MLPVSALLLVAMFASVIQPSRSTPTHFPTRLPASLSPTKNITSAGVLVFLEAVSGGNSWDGVQFMLTAPDNSQLYTDAPNADFNPIRNFVQVLTDGIYTIVVDFPSTPSGTINTHDLNCKVYWNITLLDTDQSFQGTYNSTLVLSWNSHTHTWQVLFSENLVSTRPVCVPSAAPTSIPSTSKPTASPSASPTARPSARPTAIPSNVPTTAPSSNATDILIFLEAVSGSSSWDGVEFLFSIPGGQTSYADAPSAIQDPVRTLLALTR